MNSAFTGIGAISMFTEDLEASKAFYADVFGLSPIFEGETSVVFQFGELVLNVLKTEEAHGLIAPAKVAGPDAGVRMQFTVEVDDVDAVCAELAGKGVSLINGPVDQPWGRRTACFADPSGHNWEVAQILEG
jgi:catechol 2,3-dioxygenase-like lactoylglutathione lyase family enzyme